MRLGTQVLKRLPLYLRLLREMEQGGNVYASGAALAEALNLDPIVVRKDLAKTGAVRRAWASPSRSWWWRLSA